MGGGCWCERELDFSPCLCLTPSVVSYSLCVCALHNECEFLLEKARCRASLTSESYVNTFISWRIRMARLPQTRAHTAQAIQSKKERRNKKNRYEKSTRQNAWKSIRHRLWKCFFFLFLFFRSALHRTPPLDVLEYFVMNAYMTSWQLQTRDMIILKRL